MDGSSILTNAQAALAASKAVTQAMNEYADTPSQPGAPASAHAVAIAAKVTHSIIHLLAPGHPVLAAVDQLWTGFGALASAHMPPQASAPVPMSPPLA